MQGPPKSRSRRDENNVTVFVLRRDFGGPRIPPEELELISGAFYRGEPSRSRETGGAGLGLAIADAAVQLHGGKLAFANRAGGGLIASIILPFPRACSARLPQFNGLPCGS